MHKPGADHSPELSFGSPADPKEEFWFQFCTFRHFSRHCFPHLPPVHCRTSKRKRCRAPGSPGTPNHSELALLEVTQKPSPGNFLLLQLCSGESPAGRGEGAARCAGIPSWQETQLPCLEHADKLGTQPQCNSEQRGHFTHNKTFQLLTPHRTLQVWTARSSSKHGSSSGSS